MRLYRFLLRTRRLFPHLLYFLAMTLADVVQFFIRTTQKIHKMECYILFVSAIVIYYQSLGADGSVNPEFYISLLLLFGVQVIQIQTTESITEASMILNGKREPDPGSLISYPLILFPSLLYFAFCKIVGNLLGIVATVCLMIEVFLHFLTDIYQRQMYNASCRQVVRLRESRRNEVLADVYAIPATLDPNQQGCFCRPREETNYHSLGSQCLWYSSPPAEGIVRRRRRPSSSTAIVRPL